MTKTSTLVYSLHNLASKAEINIYDTEQFSVKQEFSDVFNALDTMELIDVRQNVVDRILDYTKSI